MHPAIETMSRMSMCHQSALTVNPLIHFGLYHPVGPFIRSFRVQEGISANAFLDLLLSLGREWINYQREGLRPRGIELDKVGAWNASV